VTAPYQAIGGAAVPARGGIWRVVPNSWVVTKRNLRRMMRMPESFIFGLIQPAIFLLLFFYVVGGAINIAGAGTTGYREYLIPGILAQSVNFAAASASVGIADDMSKGMVNRFRTLPMSHSAVLLGRTVADLMRTALTILLLGTVAMAIGWRIRDGILPAIAAFFLLLLLSFALSWIGALIGLSVRSPEAAASGGLIWVFPVTFVSNAFIPVGSMPGWVQSIAYWNPFSATVQACRTLFGSPGLGHAPVWPMQHPVAASLLWSLLILTVFSSLSVRKYWKASR
jgi:ABC-2 type transport system permease protein